MLYSNPRTLSSGILIQPYNLVLSINSDVVPVTRLEDFRALNSLARLEDFRVLKLSKSESFRPLKFSRFESFRVLKCFGQIGVF